MTALTLRLLGAALLTGLGGAVGGAAVRSLRRRAELLRELSAGLGLMAEELTLLRTPLPDIFDLLGDRPFFCLLRAGFGAEPTAALWRRAAEALDIKQADREALASLAPVVGRYDAARQAAEISLVRARLDRSAQALEADLSGRARTYTGLGLSLGAMLAVILF